MAETRDTASGPGPGRKAQSPFGQFAGPRPATRCRERSGSAGNIFASCMISGPSTRKGGLDGKIRAPCILNRPIAPGNGYIRRGSCHSDLEKHAFRADIAREGPFSRIRRKRDAYGAILASQDPGAAETREGDADGGARWRDAGDGTEPGFSRDCRSARARGSMGTGSSGAILGLGRNGSRWRREAGLAARCRRYAGVGCGWRHPRPHRDGRAGRDDMKIEAAYAASLRKSDKF